jgi:hypothetical protein
MMQETQSFGVYDVIVRRGTLPRLGIILTGIGDPSKAVVEFDFLGTIKRIDPRSSIIFVRDSSRSWYNNQDGLSDLVNFLKSYIDSFGIQSVCCVGLSAGAYGACVISQFIDVDVVLAMSTRAVLEKNGFDTRNKSIVNSVECFHYNKIENFLQKRTKYVFLSSIDEPFDVVHLGLIPELENVYKFCTKGSHNLASELGARGHLDSIFVQFLSTDTVSLDSFGMFGLSGGLLELCRQKIRGAEADRRILDSESMSMPLRDMPIHELSRFKIDNMPVIHASTTIKLHEITTKYSFFFELNRENDSVLYGFKLKALIADFDIYEKIRCKFLFQQKRIVSSASFRVSISNKNQIIAERNLTSNSVGSRPFEIWLPVDDRIFELVVSIHILGADVESYSPSEHLLNLTSVRLAYS